MNDLTAQKYVPIVLLLILKPHFSDTFRRLAKKVVLQQKYIDTMVIFYTAEQYESGGW